MKKNPIDALNDWFDPGKVRSVKSKSTSTISRWRPNAGQPGKSPTRLSGKATAALLAKKTPQVMVKITGSGKGMSATKNHLDYISRNGNLELIDQDGREVSGREAVNELKDEWRDSGVPEDSAKRECFNIMFGMPVGTPPEAIRKAVQEFAEQEFPGHKYVMALHESRSDDRTKNPHVHLCVVATDDDGRRLNPRKADLQRWREGFAAELRHQGVEALATRRRQHLQRTDGEGFKKRKKRERITQEKTNGRPVSATRRTKRTSPAVRRAAALYQSGYRSDARGAEAVSPARLRNVSAGHVVREQSASKQRAAAMFLQQNAPMHLGREGGSRDALRRAGTGARSPTGADQSVKKQAFEAQLRHGAKLLLAAAQELQKENPNQAAAIKRYAARVGVGKER